MYKSILTWLISFVLSMNVGHAEMLFVGANAEYETINEALAMAGDGDTVSIGSGRYEETIETQRPGVTIQAAGDGSVLVTSAGYLLRIRHERITVDGLILDGQYSDRDGVQVRGDAHDLTLKNMEIRHVGSDCIDLGSQRNVTIENSVIHHCLRSTEPDCSSPDCRADAHGIAGAAMRNLTIRNTEIHTFSGDAIQLDASRTAPGWTGLTIDGCRFWLGPLAVASGGFAAGIVPGENALDTKTSNDVVEPAEVRIHDTDAWGFKNGLIDNMAVFNLKENVRVHLDRVTVSGSEIAFRLRGRTDTRPRGAQVTLSNVLMYEVDTAIRYEDDIDAVQMDNVTLGRGINRFFRDLSSAGQINGRNVLVISENIPDQLDLTSNLAVDESCFMDPVQHDYRLMEGCAAIDSGSALESNAIDRIGVIRPQGGTWDIGAFEFCDGPCTDGQTQDRGVDMMTDLGLSDAMPDGQIVADANAQRDFNLSVDSGPLDGNRASSLDAELDSAAAPAGSRSGSCSSALPRPSTPIIWTVYLLILVSARRWSRRRRRTSPLSHFKADRCVLTAGRLD